MPLTTERRVMEEALAERGLVNPLPYENDYQWTAWALGAIYDAAVVSLNVKNFGAIGDSVFDNATAFAKASSAVNAVPVGTPVTLSFPDGIWTFTGGLVFTREVTCTGSGVLNYVGSGILAKCGADNFNVVNEPTNRHYIWDGLGFIGGATMTQGIYFNTLVTQPIVKNCKFYKFGNANAWGIFGQSSNWYMVVQSCQWVTDSTDTAVRNWIRCNGYDINSNPDQGQSRLRVIDCLASEQGSGASICVYANGVNNEIVHCKLEGFAACVQIAAYATKSRVIDCYFETTKGTETIRFGDSTGPQTGAFTQNLHVRDCFSNLHNSDAYNTTASFIGNATSQSGLQYSRVYDNDVTLLNAGRELIRQNNVASQIDNRAGGNTGWTVLHTAGGSITAWSGEDEQFNPVAVNQDSAALKYQRLHGGFTVNATSTLDVVISWTTAFPDGEYTPVVSIYDDNSGSPSPAGAAANLTWTILSWNGTGVTVRLNNPTANAISGGVAIHAIYGG